SDGETRAIAADLGEPFQDAIGGRRWRQLVDSPARSHDLAKATAFDLTLDSPYERAPAVALRHLRNPFARRLPWVFWCWLRQQSLEPGHRPGDEPLDQWRVAELPVAHAQADPGSFIRPGVAGP